MRMRAALFVLASMGTACSERPSLAAAVPEVVETAATSRTLEVGGLGIVVGSPRLATFSVLVEVWAPRASDAWRDGQVVSRRVATSIRKSGVRGTDVYERALELVPAVRGELVVNPVPEAPDASEPEASDEETVGDYSAAPPDAPGYVARQVLTVIHREPDKVTRALSAAMRAGAARVSDFVVTPNNSDVLIERARQRAVQDARGRGKVLAQELGLQLAQPLEVHEVTALLPGDDPRSPLEARVEVRVLFTMRPF